MKNCFLQGIVLLSLSMPVHAQKSNPAEYAKIVNSENLRKHLTIIASDEMEGRETGTAGQRKAAAYIESQFKLLGLTFPEQLKGFQQFYPLQIDSLVNTSLSIDEEKQVFGTDFIIPLIQNESGTIKSNDIVFVGYGIDDPAYSNYKDVYVKGKTVLFFLGEPKKDGKYFIHPEGKVSAWSFPGLQKKLQVAAEKGAVAALVVNPAQESFTQRMADQAKKTNVYYPPAPKTTAVVNHIQLSHTLAKKLVSDSLISLAKSGLLPQQAIDINKPLVVEFKKYTSTIEASNVIGVVEGSDKKDEYVFLTAHYDHLGIRDGKIYNGADDDGSGTVAVIQMAEAFMKAKKEGNGPRRTVVFMTVSGEEKGLWGSEYYSDHPIFPLEKTSVDLNTDMIGRIDTERKTPDSANYVYVVGHDKISSDLPAISETTNNAYTKLVFDYKFDDPNDPHRIYFRSDHYNFARKGVPVLFFYDGMLKADYHKPTDDIEWINWPLFEKRAQMIFYTAWEMANRNEMLVRDKPIPTATR